MSAILTRRVRAWLYGIAAAFVPLAVLLGWMTLEASPLVLALILALLNLTPDDVASKPGRHEAGA